MSARDGYALDLVTPVRYVATELDGAAPAALSLGDLAANYRHPIPADLTRIKQHEDVKTDAAAVALLMRRAVEALNGQLISSDDGLRLARPFDQLRYERKKIVRLVAQDSSDDRRALRGVYADLRKDRAFYVKVGARERQYKLHPLAREIPQMSEDDFLKMADDIKVQGVKMPIVVYDGQVLDGRHRVALASALKMPVRVDEFKGTEDEARDHVISLNVVRRHLTVAQRGLLVRKMYLPQAKKEAEAARLEGNAKGGKSTAEVRETSRGPTATEIAATASSGLANVRTIETMAPVDNAPKTQERIRSGEIKTASEARREALKETGSSEPEKLPAVQPPRTAYYYLGNALRDVGKACEELEAGSTDTTGNDLVGRINEIRQRLDRAEYLIGRRP